MAPHHVKPYTNMSQGASVEGSLPNYSQSKSEKQDASPDPENSPPEPNGPQNLEGEIKYPEGWALALIFVSIVLAAFLIALDRAILATAIPFITDEFNSLGDIGWYGSAYMLTNSATQLLFGRIYKFYSTKWVYLTSIVILEIGSLICGVAPTSKALIVGRAIAGVGSAGAASGAMMIILHTIPLHKRPLYMTMLMGTFSIASVFGPLLGGVFTDKATWRWCFLINLPIGAITLCVISIILKVPKPKEAGLNFRLKMNQLDPLGSLCFIPSMICLILALQWGGTTYTWSDGRVVALLVIFAVLLVAFIGIQIWKGENGTIPPRIIRQRSIAFGVLYTFCFAASMIIFMYYLPLWFQAIKGVSAINSGLMTIPFVLSLFVASIFSGATTQRLGYYVPSMIASSTIMAVGAGLITTFSLDTGQAGWIGFQVVYGFGVGIGLQASNLAAQTVLDRSDVSIGIALMMFAQQLGGALFLSVGENLLASHLISNLSQVPESSSWLPSVINTGATDLRNIIPAQYLGLALAAYNSAIIKCFDVGVAMACLMIIGALGMEWKSIKKNKAPAKESPEGTEKDLATQQKTEQSSSL